MPTLRQWLALPRLDKQLFLAAAWWVVTFRMALWLLPLRIVWRLAPQCPSALSGSRPRRNRSRQPSGKPGGSVRAAGNLPDSGAVDPYFARPPGRRHAVCGSASPRRQTAVSSLTPGSNATASRWSRPKIRPTIRPFRPFIFSNRRRFARTKSESSAIFRRQFSDPVQSLLRRGKCSGKRLQTCWAISCTESSPVH